MASPKLSDAEIWSGILQESGVGSIAVGKIRTALKDIHRLQDIFSDELNPLCRYPVGQSDDSLVVSQLWNRKGKGGEVWIGRPGF